MAHAQEIQGEMTFYTIHIDTAETLGLYGSDAQVYFALAYLAKHQPWRGSYRELARLSRCGKSKSAAFKCVQRLLYKGLLVQTDEGLKVSKLETQTVKLETPAVKLETNLKESNKENINNIKERMNVMREAQTLPPSVLSSFNEFWNNYAPIGADRKYKRACLLLWSSEKMPEEWRRIAVERAKEHPADRKVFFWLKDEDFLRVDGGAQAAAEKPHWLSGVEQDDCLRGGIALAVCKNPETGLFGTVTKEDAARFKLEILREM